MRRAPVPAPHPETKKSRPHDSLIDLGFLGESDQRIAFIESGKLNWVELPIAELQMSTSEVEAVPIEFAQSMGPSSGIWDPN
jgi:hypothetical protein